MIIASLMTKVLGGVSLALALAAGVFYFQARHRAERIDALEISLADAEARTVVLEETIRLREISAGERAADIKEVDKLEEDLIDAVRAMPDSTPGPARVALGCLRLRAAGKDTTSIPACSGS